MSIPPVNYRDLGSVLTTNRPQQKTAYLVVTSVYAILSSQDPQAIKMRAEMKTVDPKDLTLPEIEYFKRLVQNILLNSFETRPGDMVNSITFVFDPETAKQPDKSADTYKYIIDLKRADKSTDELKLHIQPNINNIILWTSEGKTKALGISDYVITQDVKKSESQGKELFTITIFPIKLLIKR